MGLNQFNEIRQLAIIKQAQARLGQAESQNQAVEVSQGDHFHNGHRVLEDVTNWHICLRTVLRKSDSITSQVLDLVDEDMLLGSAQQRINASRLCSRLDLILKSSSQASDPQLPDTIKAVLEEAADVGLIYQPSVIRHSQATGGKGASSYTATVRGTRRSVYERSLDGSSGPVAEPPVMSPSTFPTPRKATTHDRISSDFNIQTIPIYRSRRGTLKKHTPMNVFQAREAIERRKEGSKLFHRNKHEETKDNWLLTSYFRGNRNIVSDQHIYHVPNRSLMVFSRYSLLITLSQWRRIGTKQHTSSRLLWKWWKVWMRMEWIYVLRQELSNSRGEILPPNS